MRKLCVQYTVMCTEVMSGELPVLWTCCSQRVVADRALQLLFVL
jgi:hypothetical protein